MLRFRKASTIPFTASQFRVDQPNAIPFTTSGTSLFGPDELGREQETAPYAALLPDSPEDNLDKTLGGSRTAPTRNLAISTPKTNRKESSLSHRQLSLSKVLLFLCCLLVHSYLPNIVCFAEQRLACIIPLQITRFILRPGRQYDWHHTAFTRIIPFGYGRTSLNAGAMVTPKLTASGIDSVPSSSVLSNAAGACWSFHGNSGTFGIALDTPNVIPSHVAIRHWPFNSTASLSRAPRQVTVWGLVDGEANMKIFSRSRRSFTSAIARVPRSLISKEGVFLPLAEIDFDITARSLHQVFPLYSEALSLGIDFGVIVFDIRSNWGAEITSLCSVHVYGGTVLVD